MMKRIREIETRFAKLNKEIQQLVHEYNRLYEEYQILNYEEDKKENEKS